jgi:hypothetical protein
MTGTPAHSGMLNQKGPGPRTDTDAWCDGAARTKLPCKKWACGLRFPAICKPAPARYFPRVARRARRITDRGPNSAPRFSRRGIQGETYGEGNASHPVTASPHDGCCNVAPRRPQTRHRRACRRPDAVSSDPHIKSKT